MSKIISGDYLKVMRNMAEKSVDAVVTGRPYGLSFIGKRRDYDVPSTEIWAECLPVLKPSDHLQAFAGTRTQQRMAARIEDASFEIPDMIAWIYGSGFPKSHNGPWGHRAQARARADHRCPQATCRHAGNQLALARHWWLEHRRVQDRDDGQARWRRSVGHAEGRPRWLAPAMDAGRTGQGSTWPPLQCQRRQCRGTWPLAGQCDSRW